MRGVKALPCSWQPMWAGQICGGRVARGWLNQSSPSIDNEHFYFAIKTNPEKQSRSEDENISLDRYFGVLVKYSPAWSGLFPPYLSKTKHGKLAGISTHIISSKVTLRPFLKSEPIECHRSTMAKVSSKSINNSSPKSLLIWRFSIMMTHRFIRYIF